MKKLMTLCTACLVASMATAQGVESQNIVGYDTTALVAGKFNMLGGAFTTVGKDGFNLNADFTGVNLTAGADSGASDTIKIHNAATGGYATYYLYEYDAGEPDYPGGWYNAENDALFEDDYPNGLPAGSSFWYLAKATTTGASVTFAGQVPADASYTKGLVRSKFNMVASPYPVNLNLNDPAAVTLVGATAGADSGASDTIKIHNAATGGYATYYLYEYDAGEPDYPGGWYNAENDALFEDDYPNGLPVGKPFWYLAKAGSGTFEMIFNKTF